MAASKLPFAWLSRHINLLTGVMLGGLATFFRFFDISVLPPGLYGGEARVGLAALDVIHNGALPGFTAETGWSPLWVWLQSVSVAVFGHTVVALRFWPAIIGVLAVLVVWRWALDLFGRQVSWIAAFVVAVLPWAVTTNRNATAASLGILLVPLTLWLANRAYNKPTLANKLALAGIVLVDLAAGPYGWLALAAGAVTGLILWLPRRERPAFNKSDVALWTLLAVGITAAATGVIYSWDSLAKLPQILGLDKPADLGKSALNAIMMFDVRGDDNFRHNFAGQPLLNAFLGLMFVAGLLVSATRFVKQRDYRAILILFVTLLLPVVFTTVGSPNTVVAAGLIPLVALLIATGISYLLGLWYKTFPINSAAHSTGQTVIILLLILTLLQGYTQYFSAWGQSAETYVAYDEGATATAKFITKDKFTGQRFAIVAPDEKPVVEFLTYGQSNLRIIEAKDIAGLTIEKADRQFVISAAAVAEATNQLRLKFPGNILRGHASTFSPATDIYYVYESINK